MNNKELKHISKFLSYVLRHNPKEISYKGGGCGGVLHSNCK